MIIKELHQVKFSDSTSIPVINCKYFSYHKRGHFTAIDGTEAGADLVLIQPFLLILCKSCCSRLCQLVFFKHNFHKNGGFLC